MDIHNRSDLSRLQQGRIKGLTKPKIVIRILPGEMEAHLQMQPSESVKVPPLIDDLYAALADYGITHGINRELIADLCVRPVFYTVLVIARGTPPTKGADGYVEYLFNTVESRAPTIRGDGTSDYRSIDYIKMVTGGQVLCRIHQPKKGADGVNIFGKRLEGVYGREPLNPAGRNTVPNYDGSELIAHVGGRVKVDFGIVNITEVLTLSSVDNSTGNIDFMGDVVIRGNVAHGFTIRSEGSITINGTVEGAILNSGGDIKVSDGILGMSEGSIKAGGDIICKFIQSSYVAANGSIKADSIVSSNVRCGGDLVVSGPQGIVVGGRAEVRGKIIAKAIGNVRNTSTELFLAAETQEPPEEIRALEKLCLILEEEKQETLSTLSELEGINRTTNLTPAQKKRMQDANTRYGECIKEREQAEKRLLLLESQWVKAVRANCYVESVIIYANTSIRIGNYQMDIREDVARSRVQLTDRGMEINRV